MTKTRLFTKGVNVKVDIYSECKYTMSAEVAENHITVNYEACTGFEVVDGEEAKKIENESDGTCIDDCHEYLILFFEDGSEATFRNSYVDLFRM